MIQANPQSPSPEQLRKIVNDFSEFLAYAMPFVGYELSPFQKELADHIQCGAPRVALFSFRGSTKTFMGCMYVVWRLLRCKDIKVKVVCGSFLRSIEITGQILHLLNLIPIVQHLAPVRHNTSRSRFNVRGAHVEKEFSVTATSVASKNTGSRADLILCDDAEGEEVDCDDKREWVRAALMELSSIISPTKSRPFYKKWNGNLPKPERTQFLCLGTFANIQSIYLRKPGEPHFLNGAAEKRFAAVNELNESNFPERFSTEYLNEVRTQYVSPIYWACHFLLAPESINEADCPWSWEKIKADAIDAPETIPTLTGFVDPSECQGGDSSVLIVGGMLPTGKFYVHDIISRNTGGSARVFEEYAMWIKQRPEIRQVFVETNNGVHDIILKNAFVKHQVRCSVAEFKSKGEKHQRIMDTLEPVFSSGEVVLHKKLLLNKELVDQLKGFRIGGLPPQDDAVDALASLVRIHKEKLGRRPAHLAGGFIA